MIAVDILWRWLLSAILFILLCCREEYHFIKELPGFGRSLAVCAPFGLAYWSWGAEPT